MKQQTMSSHLPNTPCDAAAYEKLYKDSFDFCFADFDECSEIRIPSGSSAEDVYRRLPSAKNFEYGGYLTNTRIRYVAGDAEGAYTDESKPCTFHSHPSGHRYADVPSPQDVYHFLKWRQLRAITVGARWIWVWTKDSLNMKTVQRLNAWEKKHMEAELFGHGGIDEYKKFALRQIGCRWPRKPIMNPARWSVLLRESLGIKTLLIRR